MTKKTTVVWRLKTLPSIDEIRGLVADKLLTPEQAKDILFSEETIEPKTKEDLEGEIRFLRGLVDKLSADRVNEVVRYIEIEKPARPHYWYDRYWITCQNTSELKNSTNFSSITTGKLDTLSTAAGTTNTAIN